MKKALIILASLLFSSQCYSVDIPLTFQWDADIGGNWKEIHFYVRENDEAYDFNVPDETILQEYVNGASQPIELNRVWTFPDGQETTLHWIAKAADEKGNLSEQSNEVSYTLNLVPLKVLSLNVQFEAEQQLLKISWTAIDNRAKRFRIYYSENKDGPYDKQLALVNNDGVLEQQFEYPIKDIFPEDALSIRYFIIKSFGDYGLEGNDSEPIRIEIDRRSPQTVEPVYNLKIKLTGE